MNKGPKGQLKNSAIKILLWFCEKIVFFFTSCGPLEGFTVFSHEIFIKPANICPELTFSSPLTEQQTLTSPL